MSKTESTHFSTSELVMREFKEGELHSSKTETIVINSKQAIAIALSAARKTKKNQ